MHSLLYDSPYGPTSEYDLGGGNSSDSKRMKVLGAADVSQGWINLSQNALVGVPAINGHSTTTNGWQSRGLGLRTGSLRPVSKLTAPDPLAPRIRKAAAVGDDQPGAGPYKAQATATSITARQSSVT